MMDQFGREIRYLRVSVTDRCNLRCEYCMPEDGVPDKGHENILSNEEITRIISAAAGYGISKVRLTGGEPLVRQGFIRLCEEISSIPGIEELTLTTNGLLLPAMARDLKRAGVSRVNISLDTLQADKYRRITRGGSLEGALAGIEAARAAGLYPIKINAVLIRGFNDDELMDLARLSLEEDVHVRFIELMPIGEGCRFWPEGYLSAEEAIAMMPGLESLDASDGVAQSWRLPGAGGTVGFIKPVSHHFCGSCNRLRLTADGMLKPCLHSDSEIPVRGLQGEALKAAFEAAIKAKPAENREMSALMPSRAGRPMNRIGG